MGIKLEARGCREDTNERSAQIWKQPNEPGKEQCLAIETIFFVGEPDHQDYKYIAWARFIGGWNGRWHSEISSIVQVFG